MTDADRTDIKENTDGSGNAPESTRGKNVPASARGGKESDSARGGKEPAPARRKRDSSPVRGDRVSASSRVKRKKAPGARRGKKNVRQPLPESFGHAFEGIGAGLAERNMRIHCAAAIMVVLFGTLLRITVTEWCICLALFGLIMGLELVNTSIEAVVDLVTEEYHPLAKKAKDTAAGAVLIAAIMAAAAGLIIFVPRLLYVLKGILPV